MINLVFFGKAIIALCFLSIILSLTVNKRIDIFRFLGERL